VPSLKLKAALLALLVTVPSLSGGAAAASPASTPVSGPLSLYVPGATLTASSPTANESVNFSISDPTVRRVSGMHLTIDAAGLPSGTTVDTSQNFGWTCTAAGTLTTCDAAGPFTVSWYSRGVSGFLNSYFFFTVAAPAGTAPGNGRLSFTATGAGLNTATTTAGFGVAEDVDLVGGPNTNVTVAAGDTYSARYAVTNAGTNPVHGVYLWVDSDEGFSHVTKYRNCRYNANNQAFCLFANDLEPGVTYRIATPMRFRVAARHEVPFLGASLGSWYTPLDLRDDFVQAPDGTPGKAAALALVNAADGTPAPALTTPNAAQADKNFQNYSEVDVSVTGALQTNLAAVGAAATVDAAGDPVTLRLGVRDAGAADADPSRSGEPVASVTVTVPTGTRATAVPATCAPVVNGQEDWNHNGLPGYGAYQCDVYTVVAHNQTYTLPFTFQPTTVQPAYAGSVSVSPSGKAGDDTAPIVLTAAS